MKNIEVLAAKIKAKEIERDEHSNISNVNLNKFSATMTIADIRLEIKKTRDALSKEIAKLNSELKIETEKLAISKLIETVKVSGLTFDEASDLIARRV
ncbi:hypothetical protein RX914_11005 [Pseudomonas syringae pv. actinidiae]|nr:hypothetical protein [Pseudomonas syringae pv. actinidiae]MDU8256602.1 hypothetical protein [Pseudomonas syringae pv. actinidiae]MDU8261176.1 hypothetical protein [Pseudomonas syringae pv. actinidiae]MDU8294145.1 hypothetical protein [Pseudomonas syringae pv. actinidiae]MDU8310061.1 hypothetical protein [Pseudomonas syringae pv. actinidiae]